MDVDVANQSEFDAASIYKNQDSILSSNLNSTATNVDVSTTQFKNHNSVENVVVHENICNTTTSGSTASIPSSLVATTQNSDSPSTESRAHEATLVENNVASNCSLSSGEISATLTSTVSSNNVFSDLPVTSNPSVDNNVSTSKLQCVSQENSISQSDLNGSVQVTQNKSEANPKKIKQSVDKKPIDGSISRHFGAGGDVENPHNGATSSLGNNKRKKHQFSLYGKSSQSSLNKSFNSTDVKSNSTINHLPTMLNPSLP